MDDATLKYLLRDKLESYETPPDPADWENIRRRMRRQKQRKTVMMWLPASAAAAVAALFFMLYHPSVAERSPDAQPVVASSSLLVTTPTEIQQPAPAQADNVIPATRKAVVQRPAKPLLDTTYHEIPVTITDLADTAQSANTSAQIAANDKAEETETSTPPVSQDSLRTPLWIEEPVHPEQAERKKWALALLAGQSGGISVPHSSAFMDEAYALDAPGSPIRTDDPIVNHVTETTHHIPLSFGLTFRFYFTSHWAIESGLVYTYLLSEYRYNNASRLKQQLHYLGLPVNAVYQFIGSKRFSVYVSGGGMLEKCVSANYTFIGPASQTGSRENITGIQWSLNGQLGGSYHLSKRFSLYVEPGIRYFFPDAHQPENIRTEHPLNFSLGFGIRANF
jgi:hypothetical protein